MLELLNDKHLYDVWRINEGKPDSFIMRAPLRTLWHLYKLHEEAIRRILRETNTGPECVLHIDGMKLRVMWGSEAWQILGESTEEKSSVASV